MENADQGWISKLRENDKMDISLKPIGFKNYLDDNSKLIMETLDKNNGFLGLHDKSSPDKIYQQLGISKKVFKKTIGVLYKQRLIEISSEGIKKIKNKLEDTGEEKKEKES